MNQFRILAHGEAFDVDAFLRTTTLRPDSVWRRGDQRGLTDSTYKTSGIEFVLGDGQQLQLCEQDQIAIEYVSANHEELKALASYPGVTGLTLGLQYDFQLGAATIAFTMGLSSELMRHLLDVGIEPAFHVTLDRSREWENEDAFLNMIEELLEKRRARDLKTKA